MEFRELSISDLKSLEIYKEKFILNNENNIHGARDLIHSNCYDWIRNLSLYKNKDTVPENFVTAHTFVLIEEDIIIGIINLRHELNEYLYNYGGHIGYSVAPDFRNRGYAKILLKKCLTFAFENLKLNEVLLTCDSQNIPSEKTILSCGGTLENIVNENNSCTKRFYIKKNDNL